MRFDESDAFKLMAARVDALFDRAAGAPVSSPFLTPAEQYFLARRPESAGRSGQMLFFGGAPGRSGGNCLFSRNTSRRLPTAATFMRRRCSFSARMLSRTLPP